MRVVFRVGVAGLVLLVSSSAYADNSVMLMELRKMQERLNALENKVALQDSMIREQQSLLEQHGIKLKTVDAKVSEQDKAICGHQCAIETQEARLSGVKHRLSSVTKELKIERVKFAEIDKNMPMRNKGTPGLSIQGFEFTGGATTVFQGTHNANMPGRTKKEAQDLTATADLMIFKRFQTFPAEAFMHLEAGQGAGVEDDLLVWSNVNRDVDNNTNVRLTELWYEHYFLDRKLSFIAGKMDQSIYFDNCAFANDETRQFLGRMFRNSPVIGFPPDNSVGLKGLWEIGRMLELSGGMYDGNADWDHIFTNPFAIGQINIKPKLFGRDGNYRFLLWSNDSNYTRLSNEADRLLDPDNPDLMIFNKDNNWGMGLCFDQYITDSIGIFTRFGNQDPRINIVEFSWSAGLHIEGKPWKRENDVLGLAIGQLIPGKDFRKADPLRYAQNEGHFEAYYNFKMNDFVSFGPDLQLIWNPFGNDTAEHDTIAVYGFRAQVDF